MIQSKNFVTTYHQISPLERIFRGYFNGLFFLFLSSFPLYAEYQIPRREKAGCRLAELIRVNRRSVSGDLMTPHRVIEG